MSSLSQNPNSFDSLSPGAKRFSLLEPVIAVFVGLILISNIVSQKFFSVQLFGVAFSSDVGTLLLFPLTYIFSDILTEVFGYAVARRVVWYGFAVNVLAALLFTAAVSMPHSPDFAANESFSVVLGQMPFMVIASLAGYWFGSFANDSVMAGMKLWMVKWDPQHKWLPLRTIASTVVGELVDTCLFVGVATLAKVFPGEYFFSLVITQWLVKTLIEVVLTPITVLVVRAMKKHESCDIVGTSSWNPFAFGKSGGVNLYQNKKPVD